VVGGVSCSEPTWLVGSVDPQKQKQISHTFTLKNQTAQAIPIEQVKSDCSCVVAKDHPREVPAQGEVGIQVHFKVPPAPGEFHHMVSVKFGLSEPAILDLKIHGIAAPSPTLYASPPALEFGRFMDNEKRTRTIRVSRYDLSGVAVSSLKTDLEGCTLESQPAPEGDAVLASVTLDGTRLRPGSNSGTVTVDTGHPTAPSLKIPIKADVSTAADAFVSSLLIDSIAPGARQSFSVYRSGLATTDRPKITQLEYAGDQDIRVEFPSLAGSDGKGVQRMQLSVSRDAKGGIVKKGVIRIRVAHRASSSIEVPVIVFVR
jgi:hypothetical protein